MDIATFIKTEADNIWDPDTKHFHESVARLERFCNYNENGNRDINEIEARDIRDFQKYLASLVHETGQKKDQRILTATSINRYSSAISALIKHAVLKKHATYVPYVRYKSEGDGRPRFFTEQEQKRLVAFLRRSRAPWMADMVILSLQTGMRHGEILKIGTKHSELIIGGKMPKLRLHETKNGDRRDVYLNKVAKAAYDALNGGNSYSHRVFYNVWAEARYTIARGDEDFVFHVCRHTAATKMANALGFDTTLIGKTLGHRSSETTKKYIKLTDDSSVAIAEAMCNAEAN